MSNNGNDETPWTEPNEATRKAQYLADTEAKAKINAMGSLLNGAGDVFKAAAGRYIYDCRMAEVEATDEALHQIACDSIRAATIMADVVMEFAEQALAPDGAPK